MPNARIKRRVREQTSLEHANRTAPYERKRDYYDYLTSLLGDAFEGSSFLRQIKPRGNKLNVSIIGSEMNSVATELRQALMDEHPGVQVKVTRIQPYVGEHHGPDTVENRMEDLKDIQTGSQDLVLATYVHNYTHDKVRALQEAHRILAKGGKALVTINPFTPIKFTSGTNPTRLKLKPGRRRQEEVVVQLEHLIHFLRDKGHDLQLTNEEESNRGCTLEMTKNAVKPLGLNAKLVSAPEWNEVGREFSQGVYDGEWVSRKYTEKLLEPAGHYATNANTLNKLKEFMIARMFRQPKKREDAKNTRDRYWSTYYDLT